MRELLWTPEAWADFESWLDENPEMIPRIRIMIKETARAPFSGIGKPEPLKHNLTGFWSRRITQSDRMVYAVKDDRLAIIALRYHYK